MNGMRASVCLLKQLPHGVWLRAFMPVPRVAGMGERSSGWASSLRTPYPCIQQAKASGLGWGDLEVKSLLPALGVQGVSDGSGEPRVQLGATSGLSRPSPPQDSASFWPCSALGLGWRPARSCREKGVREVLPSHPRPPPPSQTLFAALRPLPAPGMDLR